MHLLKKIKNLSILIVVITFSGCKKQENTPIVVGTEVEYKIICTSISSIKSIKYINFDGKIMDDYPAGNGVWSKKISVANKPFTAELSILIHHMNSTPLKYELNISQDGIQKTNKIGEAAYMATVNEKVTYTVNK